MEKVTVIRASEAEIVALVNKHISSGYESIVSAEEIGNCDWTTLVELPDISDEETVAKVITGTGDGQFETRAILNVLCKMGHLEAGDYVIDCTW